MGGAIDGIGDSFRRVAMMAGVAVGLTILAFAATRLDLPHILNAEGSTEPTGDGSISEAEKEKIREEWKKENDGLIPEDAAIERERALQKAAEAERKYEETGNQFWKDEAERYRAEAEAANIKLGGSRYVQ